jgi:hypothetical protein
MRYLTVDGMMSGTGVRDSVEGGYVSLDELDISPELTHEIVSWVEAYADAHRALYADRKGVEQLDRAGKEISAKLQRALPDAKISYYSNAFLRRV